MQVERLEKKEIILSLDDKAHKFLVEKGHDPEYGARPMRRAVERFLEDPLAEEILRGNLAGGEPVVVSVEEEELTFSQKPATEKASDNSIHEAAEAGKTEAVKQALADGADVNAKNENGVVPLSSAAYFGHKKVVELLIAKDADVNAKDNLGDTPIDWAVAWDEPETADLLRKHGGKISEELKPSTTKAPDISIHSAAFKGNIEAVQQHLAAGTDVNTKDGSGSTPLHTASTWGRKEIAELLIAKGADVNAKDEDGWTPLLNATIDGHKEIIELLIEKGADVNAKTNDGDTPLDKNMIDDYDDISTFGAKEEINDLLRKHGGKHGTIHSAAEGDDIEAVKEFLAAGANVNAKNRGGQTPLDMAYGEIADLLRKHGGKTGEELKALMPRLVQHGRFAFSFDAKEGKVYEVQDSFNLLNWEVVKTYTGTGDSVRFDEARYHNPPELFYRVRVVE